MLDVIQSQLEKLYHVQTHLNVGDFVIEEPQFHLINDTYKLSLCPKTDQVIVWGHPGEDLHLSVYFQATTMMALNRDFSSDFLSTEAINAFCTVVEEISHFLFICWNAMNERRITVTETEIQGEIDKYVLIAMVLLSQKQAVDLEAFTSRNFSPATLKDANDPVYQVANDLSAIYCNFLLRQFILRNRWHQLTSELRTFYRRTRHSKLDHIKSVSGD